MSNPVMTVRGDCAWMWCPGCDDCHMIRVSGDRQPVWGWDGNRDAPTFTPSLLVDYGSTAGTPKRCHSFIRGGLWEFLTDSTHALAGQTVPMVPVPDWLIREAEEE